MEDMDTEETGQKTGNSNPDRENTHSKDADTQSREEEDMNDTYSSDKQKEEMEDQANQETENSMPDPIGIPSNEDCNVSRQEECANDYGQEFAIKRKFMFVMSFDTWSKFKIKTSLRGDRYLTGTWTDLFSEEISKVNPACPLMYRWNHIRKENSRKKNCPFFSAKAQCKFAGCVEYVMKIKREPKECKQVKIRVKTTNQLANINHTGEKKGRQIKGEERKEIAKELKVKGPSGVYYEKIGNANDIAYRSGNTSGYGSKEVLQKISSEASLCTRLHKDVIAEVGLLQKVYEREDESNGHLKGVIQAISFSPFAVTVYSNDQLSILADNIRNGTGVLYFDATGQVIANIPSQPKRVLYYSLLLKGQQKGDPPVPVAELISNSHNTVDITAFLMKLKRDLYLNHPSVCGPQRVEIDYSWTFIHAIVLAFNHEDICGYLLRAWNFVNGQPWNNFTKLHICSAHLLHAISGKLAKVVNNKDSRKYILFVIARIIDAQTLEDIDKLFRSLTFVLLSEHLGTHPELAQSIAHLDRAVSGSEVDIEEEESQLEDEEPEDEVTGNKARESAFASHFARIRDEVATTIQAQPLESNVERNPHYSPTIVTYLLNNYFHVLPLWTGLLIEDGKHDTNSPAENWMKIVKKDVLGGQKRLTPSNFIIEMRASLKGRLREFSEHSHIKPGKPHSSMKRKEKNTFTNSEEKWGRKKPKKGLYFAPPAKVKPLKTSTTSTGTCFEGLHWGGKVQFGDRVLHLSNTCTVDNLLMITFYLMKKPNIRNWFEERKMSVCQTLLEIGSLFDSGHWAEGRAIWLQKYMPIPEGANWNVFGGEADKFVQHFSEIQETEVSSSCSKRLCPRNERMLRSREILLGDVKGSFGPCNLQESVRHWELVPPSSCLATTPHGPCKGVRTSTTRRFINEDPPVLVMSVSYLSQKHELTATTLPDSLCIQGKMYDLYGYTVCLSSHFKAYFLINKRWHKYNGLDRPEVTYVGERGSDGQLEHVVYILEDNKMK